jgi:hypothetical protein
LHSLGFVEISCVVVVSIMSFAIFSILA